MTERLVPARAGRREWIGLAVIALPCMLYSMDLTVLNLALPRLSADLKPSSSQQLWILDIYGFLVAGLLIPMGTLGDRIGRRRLLLIGALLFGITSVFAAYSNSAEMLIVARAVLGIAGATLAPSTLSLIRNMFLDPRQRTVAISVWVMSYSAGAAIGPPLGGILLEYFWWGSVFLIAVPVMVILLALGPVLLPEFRDPKAGRPDLISAALSLGAVLAVIYGLKRMAESGPSLLPLAAILIGVAVGAAFLRRQRLLADPLIDPNLFQSPTFSASLATYLLGTLVGFGAFVFIAQYLQLVLGMSPWRAGLWTIPWAAGFIVGSMVTPAIAHRARPATVITGGLLLTAVGFVLLTQVGRAASLALLITGSVIISVGLAPVVTLATDLIVGSAPPERAGVAAAISETASEFGGAMGIAILGSVGTAVYRSQVVASIPAGVPPDVIEAAKSTLGGATAVAQQLPQQLGADLLQAARDAFAQSMQLMAGISAVLVVGTAIMVVVLFRDLGDRHLQTQG